MTSNSPRDDNAQGGNADQQETFISHLIELRDRLLRALLGILVVFLALFAFANPIYTFLSGPLMRQLPAGSSMVAIDVASPFLTPFKLVMMLSVVIAVPWVLYQAWMFIAPGLYRHERRLALPILASSTLLFYMGMVFAYYVVFPLMFAFFTSAAPAGVEVMTDIGRYLDFVIKIFLAFGVAFEVPVLILVLVRLGVTTPETLSAKRPYVIVATFVIGMVLTPPDMISQTLLAIPMWMLFELGLVFSRLMIRKGMVEPGDDRDTGGDDDSHGD